MSDLRPAPGLPTRAQTEVRRSRFITLLARAGSEDEARDVVAAARAEFPDARHHCSAFLVAVPGANLLERSSDDGEPAGTAGTPMLEVLRGSGLTDVVAVVVRYFGGTKLGTGGLVRAYSAAVQAVLERVPRVRAVRLGLWTLDLPHADAGRVEAELRSRGIDVATPTYSAAGVRLTLATKDEAELRGAVSLVTSGTADPEPAGETVVELPVSSAPAP
ncbi:YigZ family protein [Georgenia halophila]|uniref:YigZ family protein n=1 Tax=Georgenia halophila TaxID=620889 RepID=A0ABP8L6B5_9MICO